MLDFCFIALIAQFDPGHFEQHGQAWEGPYSSGAFSLCAEIAGMRAFIFHGGFGVCDHGTFDQFGHCNVYIAGDDVGYLHRTSTGRRRSANEGASGPAHSQSHARFGAAE